MLYVSLGDHSFFTLQDSFYFIYLFPKWHLFKLQEGAN